MKRHGWPAARGRALASVSLTALTLIATVLATPTQAQAQTNAPGPASTDAKDDFDLFARASTNMRLFQRALVPGPGGAIVPTETLMPFHQSLSLAAYRIDTPIQKDGLDMQVATWGQLYAGNPEDKQQATWDLSSAFISQKFGAFQASLGRQVISGGAARYRRMDGAVLRATTPFGVTLSGYGGWTALPRWDQWYGYHNLGSNYDNWVRPDVQPVVTDRGQNFMGGFHLDWQAQKIGRLGVSFHGQGERNTIESKNLGADFALDYFKNVQLTGDLIFSLEQQRLADVRVSGVWDVFRKGDTSLDILGEFLHSVPSALLSQASIFSVFSYGEITEAGGEANARLPLHFGVAVGGYAQTYNEGGAGARLRSEIRYATDDDETLLVRLQVNRVSVETTGYWVLRAAARYRFFKSWSLAGDAYRYTYDQAIEGFRSSTFLSTQLVYEPQKPWDARLGGTVNESPYAALDAQLLARFTYHWDARRQ